MIIHPTPEVPDDAPTPGATEPIPIVRLEPAPKTAPNNSERIQKQFKNSSEPAPKTAPEIPDAPGAPALTMPDFQMEGSAGRKRKYEDEGVYGDISVQDVVLYRHIKQRHYPGLSGDMRYWYEHFYFKAPVVGEKPFRGKDYEQHERAYKRGREWIAAYEAEAAANEAVGHSGPNVVPFRQRANS